MWIYDILYFIGSLLIEHYNPCKITKTPGGKATCAMNGPCCGRCEHLGDNGCTVKALGCKIALCREDSWETLLRTRNWKELGYGDLCYFLNILQAIARKYRIGTIRKSKIELYRIMKKYTLPRANF